MIRALFGVSRLGLCLLTSLCLGQVGEEAGSDELAALVRTLIQTERPVFTSDEGWLLLRRELQALAQAPAVLPAMVSQGVEQDSAYSILLGTHQMLADAGITLILTPVPAKAAVYADQWSNQGSYDHEPFTRFYEALRRQGVIVVDLYADFQAMRARGQPPYCRQDSHWSPAAAALTAEKIAAMAKPWLTDESGGERPRIQPPRPFSITGDLVEMSGAGFGPETLTARAVLSSSGSFSPDRQSPFLVMGDSHTLVYSQDLLASQAGLPDHLWAQLGMAPDLVGVLGGGVNAARIQLARRRDNLAGKTLVVWCFSARQLVTPVQPWKPVPMIRP